MKNIFNIAKQIDIFGVPITILTNKGEEKFRSLQGGFITLLIVVTSLIYFIYIMQQWIGGQIAPNISSSQKTIDYSEFVWESELIYFQASDPASNIDPFRKINNYITPLLFTVHGISIYEAPIVLFSDDQSPGKVVLKNGSIVLNNMANHNEQFKQGQNYLLVFAVCNSKYMTQDSNCASDEELQKYFNEFHGFMSVNVNLQKYNFTTNYLQTVPKTVFTALSLQSSQYSYVAIKQQQTVVDDGVLMVNNNYYSSTYDFSMINQSIDSKYASNIIKQFYKGEGNYNDLIQISSYQINLDNIEVIEQVTLPKLNFILAQIGSIVQVIFFLKYIAIYINGTLIEEDQFHQIVMMYYPNLRQIAIKRNIFGTPNGAHCLNENHKLNEGFLSSYKKLIEIAKQKTSLTNIVYEISRLQFIVESRLGLEVLKECHDLGSKANFIEESQLGPSSSAPIQIDAQNEKQGISEAITLLSKARKDDQEMTLIQS